MAIKDLEKQRSQYAYGCVVEANKKSAIKKEYKSYVKKIPMMVLNNGLGATFAFIYSKKKNGNAYALIDSQTKKWFKIDEKEDLVKWIIEQESSEYRSTTNEVLALFGWLKRFADGMIEGESDGD